VKAKIIQEEIYANGPDFVQGITQSIKRLFVEEAERLTITPDNNEVLVWIGFNPLTDCPNPCQVIGEVEVPDELVEKALALAHAQAEFSGLLDGAHLMNF